MINQEIDAIVTAALQEDMPGGDITSESMIPADSTSYAVIVAKEDGILAGIDVAERVFHKVDPDIVMKKAAADGSRLSRGNLIAEVSGSSISLLKAERTALNFMQRMSGIATYTNRFVKVLEGTSTKVLDTRKTTPNLRILEKYAVKQGGGTNHRFSLSDMVLIKDNHLELVGSIRCAVKAARAKVGAEIKVEVETKNLEEVREALESGADIIMLDNMSPDAVKEAVRYVGGRIPLEVSGNVDLGKAAELALLGVDYISVGGLTHSFKSLDISMLFRKKEG